MRNIVYYFVLLALPATVLIGSCKDPCKDVECLNQGVCDDGECLCKDGYIGSRCETEERERFIGVFRVTEECSNSTASAYEVNIKKSSANVERVLIDNFWEVFQNSVTATIDGVNITVAVQEPDNDGWTVEGSGTYSNDDINWDYTVKGPDGQEDRCVSTWGKL